MLEPRSLFCARSNQLYDDWHFHQTHYLLINAKYLDKKQGANLYHLAAIGQGNYLDRQTIKNFR